MAFVFTFVGLLMIATGVNGTYAQFWQQVVSDFTGSKPFTYWVFAIVAVGALGYIESLRTFSRLFLALILVSMVLANKGFFSQLSDAIKQGPIAPQGGTGAPASSGGGSASSMLQPGSSTSGAFGQSPGQPGATGTAGQSKFNQYMNTFMQFLAAGA